jgi:hypothetical protein
MNRDDPAKLAEAEVSRDRDWFVPSALLTGLLGLAALLLMPVAGYHEIPLYFSRLVSWVIASLNGILIVAALYLGRLIHKRVDNPLRKFCQNVVEHGRSYGMAAVALMLAGIDMAFFMWIKPEVTALSPFWADNLFADMDHALFGVDPWRLFEGMDLTFHAWAYSFFWAFAIMGALVWLFVQPASRARSTSILNYFVLWSLFGPIGQILGSSAGPIFYERVGLGDRFAGLHGNIPWVTQQISDYLWTFHTSGEPAVGAGISAMPSMHIATVVWIVLAFSSLKSRLTPLMFAFALYIWAMSVALGWHYAIDGVVGALGAIGCHALSRWYLVARQGRGGPAAVPALQSSL